MESSIRTGLSTADKQRVMTVSVHTFGAAQHQVANFKDLSQGGLTPEGLQHLDLLEHIGTVAAINIACLWFESPQVNPC